MSMDTDFRSLLEETERRHVEAMEAARRASDARIRTVNDARDAGLSYGEMAEAMNAGRAGHTVQPLRRGDLTHILASGYPEEG